MPIYDNNGTSSFAIMPIYDNNGTTNAAINYVYDNNGTTNSLVYAANRFLFDNGNANSTFIVSEQTYSYASVGSTLRLYGSGGIGYSRIVSYSAVSLAGWNYLKFNLTNRSFPGTNGGVYCGIATTQSVHWLNGPWTAYINPTSAGTVTLNISSYTGSFYIIFAAGWSTGSGTLEVNANQIWLSN